MKGKKRRKTVRNDLPAQLPNLSLNFRSSCGWKYGTNKLWTIWTIDLKFSIDHHSTAYKPINIKIHAKHWMLSRNAIIWFNILKFLILKQKINTTFKISHTKNAILAVGVNMLIYIDVNRSLFIHFGSNFDLFSIFLLLFLWL